MIKIYAIFQFVQFQHIGHQSSVVESEFIESAIRIVSQSLGMCHRAFYSKIIIYYLAFNVQRPFLSFFFVVCKKDSRAMVDRFRTYSC